MSASSEPEPAPSGDAGKKTFASDLARWLDPKALQGPLLVLGLVLALIAQNSGLGGLYDKLLHAVLAIRLEDFGLQKPLLLWINDGLMALFFLLVAVEVKHELIEGHLSSPSQITFPAVCALAGVVVPAGIYLLCTMGDATAMHGWAVPAATDIAFSMALLGVFHRRAPRSLIAFLMALAVIDDLAAIVIIAVFYAGEISWTAQLVALTITVLLFLCNRLRVTSLGVYLFLGLVLWVAVLKSGVHATLAGVVLGFAIPYRGKTGQPSPMRELEHRLHPWVAIVVLPVFAFANSGISFTGFGPSMLLHPVSLGITLGLVLGKSVGVFGAGLLLATSGLARLPEGSSRSAFLGVSALSGIGFTMSMFIGSLAFEQQADYAPEVRLGVLAGSVIAATCGALLLHFVLPKADMAARVGLLDHDNTAMPPTDTS